MIAVPLAFNLFNLNLSIDMWTEDFYDFLSQIDEDSEVE